MARAIPSSGERLPVIGLGTASNYDRDDPAERSALGDILRLLAAGGGSLVDTASSYGAAESMLGAALAETGLRPRIFIATKLEEDELTMPGLRASQRRLGSDKIDLMQLHNVSRRGQSLAPLREWKAQRLIRYFGITTSDDRDFAAVESELQREKPDFLQVNYSLSDREAEKRLLPAAAEIGVAVLTDLPFGRGQVFRAVRGKTVPDWAQEFDAATWGQFFLKYLLADPRVTAVIPGTDKPQNMADNLGAGRGRLPDAAQRRHMAQFFDALG